MSAILPLRGYVKGSTVEKLAESGQEFFGSNMSVIVFECTRPNGTQSTIGVFTSGTHYDHEIGDREDFYHDQTNAYLGTGRVVGKFSIFGNGAPYDMIDVDLKTKIRCSYTYK